MIGFYPEANDDEIVHFLNETGLFEPVAADSIFQWDSISFFNHILWKNDPKASMIYVKIKEPKTTYTQLKEIIRSLQMSPIVRVAEPTFCQLNCWDVAAFAFYFFVKVKDRNDLSDLYAVMEETNTWIIAYLDDPRVYPVPYLDRFLLGADKNSKGNARQMANYFLETGKFVDTSPKLISKFVYMGQ